MQQWSEEVSFEIEIKLKSKDVTHKTSVRSREELSCSEPICVTVIDWPLGKLILTLWTTYILVRNWVLITMWLVAPVSMTQSVWEIADLSICWLKKTEWLKLGLLDDARHIGVPAIFDGGCEGGWVTVTKVAT